MKAMILAAGFGTRLAELGLDLPKPLFPVLNVPLIRWAVAFLKGHGIEEIIVNLHHRGEMIRDELGDGAALGVHIEYSMEEGEILGTGGGIKRALPFFGGPGGETFVVMNGKIVSDIDLHAAIAHHRQTGAAATMVLKPDPEAAKWGAIGIDGEGRIRRFLGAPDPSPAGVTEHMFTGVHLLEPRFVAALPDGPCCIVRAGYKPRFAAGDTPLSGYLHRGYFWDHSTPARWWQGNMNLLDPGREIPHAPPLESLAHVPDGVTVTPPVHIAPDAILEPGARVGPNLVVGPRATLRPGARAAHAVVCRDSVLSTAVDHAVVSPDNQVLSVDPSEAGPRTGPALGKSQGGS